METVPGFPQQCPLVFDLFPSKFLRPGCALEWGRNRWRCQKSTTLASHQRLGSLAHDARSNAPVSRGLSKWARICDSKIHNVPIIPSQASRHQSQGQPLGGWRRPLSVSKALHRAAPGNPIPDCLVDVCLGASGFFMIPTTSNDILDSNHQTYGYNSGITPCGPCDGIASSRVCASMGISEPCFKLTSRLRSSSIGSDITGSLPSGKRKWLFVGDLPFKNCDVP